MKKVVAIILLMGLVFLQAPLAIAQTIEVENKVIMVAENELVELSAQKKFDGLIMIMQELVKQKIESNEEIEIEEINIVNFELIPQEGFKIYYNLD